MTLSREQLLSAIKPFYDIAKDSSGRIPHERLSGADWHSLWKAYEALRALPEPGGEPEIPDEATNLASVIVNHAQGIDDFDPGVVRMLASKLLELRAANAELRARNEAMAEDFESHLHKVWGFAKDHPEKHADGYRKDAFAYVLAWLRNYALKERT